jgi:predicted TIM-barrel fold metal-dependent hydrolase
MTENSTLPKAYPIPPMATDCHVHIFDPERFPYSESRSYTPGTVTVDDLKRFHLAIGIEKSVLVQASVYAADNRCLIDALERLGPKAARGIAVIDPASATDSELRALQRAGVVGVRVNLNVLGENRSAAAVAAVSRVLKRAAPVGLSVQIYVDLPLVSALVETISEATVPVVLDHFGGSRAHLGLNQPGFDALRSLLKNGKVWVKMSAPYRASSQKPDYPDIAPIARALVAENPDRLIWASDWPHTGGGEERRGRRYYDIEPFQKIDDRRILELLSSWVPNRDTHRRILVDNPMRLYGF